MLILGRRMMTVIRCGVGSSGITASASSTMLAAGAVSAVAAGYRVIIPADASGTTTALADAATHDRLRSAGAEVASTYGVLFELYSDLSTPEGHQAEADGGLDEGQPDACRPGREADDKLLEGDAGTVAPGRQRRHRDRAQAAHSEGYGGQAG